MESQAEQTGATFMAVCLLLFIVGPFIFPILYGMATSRRLGKMRTRSEGLWNRHNLEQARERMLKLLSQNGFVVHFGSDAANISASRHSHRATTGILEHYGVHSHADKAVNVRANFEPWGADTKVHLEVWLDEFIIADTGEGAYVDGVIQALLLEPGSVPAPVTVPPNPLFLFKVALCTGILLAACPVAMVLLKDDPARTFGLAMAMFIAAPIAIILPIVGFVGTIFRKGEVTGQRQGVYAIILTLIGVLASAAIVYSFHGGEILEMLNKNRKKPATEQRRLPQS